MAAGSDTFAQAARRLAGVAGAMWGWSPAAFWHATPDELAAVVDAVTGIGAGAGAVDGTGAPADGAMLARLRERYPDG